MVEEPKQSSSQKRDSGVTNSKRSNERKTFGLPLVMMSILVYVCKRKKGCVLTSDFLILSVPNRTIIVETAAPHVVWTDVPPI
jgi:hypothetical protein